MLKERLLDIDRATGLAIALVVLGHFATGEPKAGAEWYYNMKNVLYTFHMAFFMYLSGTIMYYTLEPMLSILDYRNYISKKFTRLIPAYLLFSLIIFLGKLLSQRFLNIDNPVESYFDFFKVLYAPQDSFSGTLWYVYVLFEFYLFVSLGLLMLKRIEYLLIFAIIVHFIQFPRLMGLNMAGQYLMYFIIGCFCMKYYTIYTKFLDDVGWLFLIIFLGLLFYCFYTPFYQNTFTSSNILLKTLNGLLSIPALHYLVRINIFEKMTVLYVFQFYSFQIYLMNTIVIGIVKCLAFKVTYWDYHQFNLVFPFLLLSGLYVPIFIKKYILRYIPVLDRIIY